MCGVQGIVIEILPTRQRFVGDIFLLREIGHGLDFVIPARRAKNVCTQMNRSQRLFSLIYLIYK